MKQLRAVPGQTPNKKMEQTTKAAPTFRKFKYFNGFCVSSFSTLYSFVIERNVYSLQEVKNEGGTALQHRGISS